MNCRLSLKNKQVGHRRIAVEIGNALPDGTSKKAAEIGNALPDGTSKKALMVCEQSYPLKANIPLN